MPDNFKHWINENKERLENAKSLPLFVGENGGYWEREKKLSRYKNTTFKDFYKGKNGGKVEIFTSGKQNKVEQTKNENALKLLADKGYKYRLLPVIEDGNKNPDALNLTSQKFTDLKITESKNGKNIVQNALKEANKQGANEVIIRFTQELNSNREVFDILKSTFKQNRAKNIETIIIITAQNRVFNIDTNRYK